jgi:hypothetical protein
MMHNVLWVYIFVLLFSIFRILAVYKIVFLSQRFFCYRRVELSFGWLSLSKHFITNLFMFIVQVVGALNF